MFVGGVAVIVFFLFVFACITMHSGPCSPVRSGSVGKLWFSGFSGSLVHLFLCGWNQFFVAFRKVTAGRKIHKKIGKVFQWE